MKGSRKPSLPSLSGHWAQDEDVAFADVCRHFGLPWGLQDACWTQASRGIQLQSVATKWRATQGNSCGRLDCSPAQDCAVPRASDGHAESSVRDKKLAKMEDVPSSLWEKHLVSFLHAETWPAEKAGCTEKKSKPQSCLIFREVLWACAVRSEHGLHGGRMKEWQHMRGLNTKS